MKTSGIYKITHIASGKTYVGSSNWVEKRLYTHKLQLRNKTHFNSKLQNSYNKYGEKAFAFEILESCGPHNLLKIEQSVIDLLAPWFNIAKITSAPMSGRRHSKESRQLISKNNKRHNKGVPQPFGARIKNVKTNGGYWIVSLLTGEIFLGCAEAARKLGLSRQNISSVIRGRLKTTGGHSFTKMEIK